MAFLAVDLVLTSHFASLEMHLSPTFMTTFVRHHLRREHVLITCITLGGAPGRLTPDKAYIGDMKVSSLNIPWTSFKSTVWPKIHPSGMKYRRNFSPLHTRSCIALYTKSSRLSKSFWSIDVLLIACNLRHGQDAIMVCLPVLSSDTVMHERKINVIQSRHAITDMLVEEKACALTQECTWMLTI
jgi:hypothetical protein